MVRFSFYNTIMSQRAFCEISNHPLLEYWTLVLTVQLKEMQNFHSCGVTNFRVKMFS